MQAFGASEASKGKSLTVNFARSSNAGDLLVLSASVHASTTNPITSVTDTAGNAWRKIGAFAVSGQYSDGEMWYAAGAAPVTSVTVRVGIPTAIAMEVQEFSGFSASALDVSSGFADTGNAPDSALATPTTATDLAVGYLAGHGSTEAIAGTALGFTNMAQQTSPVKNAAVSLVAGHSFLSSTAPTHYTGSFNAAMYWSAGVALFRSSSLTPTTAPSPASSPSPPPGPSASPPPSPSPSPATTSTCYLSTPIRAAFYYPWYPENWTQGSIYPATRYDPWLGYYSDDLNSLALYQNHIAAMEYGHIQAGIASWWGQGSRTDGRIGTMLAATHGTPFCWTLYYEPAVTGGPAQIAGDLAYIAAHYASDPSYLHVNGKPALFVYSRAEASCADAQTWVQTNNGQFYLNLQVFAGYRTCAVQPDSWHQYGPAVAEDHQAGYSFSISPGFFKYDESTPRLARNTATWQQNVADMVASNEPWQLITTFNEWLEGTAVENAVDWQTASGEGAYLDALHG